MSIEALIEERDAQRSAPPKGTQKDFIRCGGCGSTKPWGAASWCPDCGYYPGVCDSVGHGVESKAAEQEVVETAAPLMPTWTKIMLAGIGVIVVISMAAKYYFYFNDGNRGLWSLAQCGVGLLNCMVMQLWTTVVAIRQSDEFNPSDCVVSPIEIWQPTIQNLPQGAHRLCGMAWGITAFLLAVTFIGGIDYDKFWASSPSKDDPPNAVHEVVDAAAALDLEEAEADSLEGAVADFTGQSELDLQNQPLPAPELPLSCYIYGYMKDGNSSFGRVLIGASIRGVDIHVATVAAENMPEDVRMLLDVTLPQLPTQESPAVETRFSGNWLSSPIGCQVKFTGWLPNQTLDEPEIVGFSGGRRDSGATN